MSALLLVLLLLLTAVDNSWMVLLAALLPNLFLFHISSINNCSSVCLLRSSCNGGAPDDMECDDADCETYSLWIRFTISTCECLSLFSILCCCIIFIHIPIISAVL